MKDHAQNVSSDSDDSGGDELQSCTTIKKQWLDTFRCDAYLDEDWPQEQPDRPVEQNHRHLPTPNSDTVLRLVRERTAENAISAVLSIGQNLPPTNSHSNTVSRRNGFFLLFERMTFE